jgi:hypothetical protein
MSDLTRTLRYLVWFGTVCCAVIQALAARHSFDADGIAYQNIADACLRGEWHSLINGYWSPGYPFLLALWFKLFHPVSYHVPLTVRWFGVVSVIFSLFAFEIFVSAFLMFRKRVSSDDQQTAGPISDDLIRIMSYVFFLWITVFMVPASLDHPDIWMFAFYLLASAFCLRVSADSAAPWWQFALLGLALGLAYLVKAIMLPLAFCFFAALLFQKGFSRQPLTKLAIAVAAFLIVSLPFVTALSLSKGRLTYGDAGAINYLAVIAGPQQPNSTLTPQQIESYGLSASPHIADYSGILGLGTYPPWADPSFGYTPAPFRLRLRQQLNRIHVVLRFYFDLFAVQLGSLLCGLLVLVFYADSLSSFASRFFKLSVLWLPACAGFILYSLVRVDARFLPGFTVALLAAVLAAARFRDAEQGNRLSACVVAAIAILLLSQVVVQVGHDALKLPARENNYADWQVAEKLASLGIKPGDRVSYLGDTLTNHAWAYLAHVAIAAEIPKEDVSWLADRGIKVLVTRQVPKSELREGWEPIAGTDYYVLSLQQR